MTATNEKNSASQLKIVGEWEHDDFLDTVELGFGDLRYVLGTANVVFGCDLVDEKKGITLDSFEFASKEAAEAFMLGVSTMARMSA